jgi:hypothetical protein
MNKFASLTLALLATACSQPPKKMAELPPIPAPPISSNSQVIPPLAVPQVTLPSASITGVPQINSSIRSRSTSSGSGTPAGGLGVGTVTQADVQLGGTLTDQQGQLVGVIESVSPEGVLVATGSARRAIPFRYLRKSGNGLTTSLTRLQIETGLAQ